MNQSNIDNIKLSQSGGASSAPAPAPAPVEEPEIPKKNNKLREAILRTVLDILDRCTLYRSTQNVDPFLEQFFYQHGYTRYPAFDGFQFTNNKINAQFGDDLIEIFFSKAGYLRYGDKFIRYS
tara:strand:- start:324 stop:692 length:369 start_codon:yes stop_codon:yes gene_type:complete